MRSVLSYQAIRTTLFNRQTDKRQTKKTSKEEDWRRFYARYRAMI